MPGITMGRCRLKKWLYKRGISQIVLSNITGISPTQISEYSNDTRAMSHKNMILISQVLHCHAEELYEWEIIEK